MFGMLIRFITFWRDAFSHPFAWNALIFLFIYSFVINVLFGHRTFWRSKSAFTNLYKSIKRKSMKLLGIQHNIKRKQQLKKPVKDSLNSSDQLTNESSLITALDDNSFLHCLTFLSPVDILSMEIVSKSSKKLCSEHHLWYQFALQLQQKTISHLPSINLPAFATVPFPVSCPQRVKLFLYHLYIIQYLLTGRDMHNDGEVTSEGQQVCRLLIFGDVYDLSTFLSEHPGGEHILLEWKGKDATRQFLIANHSDYAKSTIPKSLMWDSSKAFGKKGYPQFVKAWL